jgi:hypothetical protein
MDRQRNDRLGRTRRFRQFKHRREILRASWSHTDANCNANSNYNTDVDTYADVYGETYSHTKSSPHRSTAAIGRQIQ